MQVMFGVKQAKIQNAANFLHLLNAIHITIQKGYPNSHHIILINHTINSGNATMKILYEQNIKLHPAQPSF